MADTYLWILASGPGTVTIVDPTALATEITDFSAAGTYVFILTVTRDGTLEESVTVTVVVQECDEGGGEGGGGGPAGPCEGFPLPLIHQWFDQIADPAHDYKLHSYVAGTSTPLATYFDEARTIKNPNPMVLDAAARNTIFVGAGVEYRLVMTDVDGTVIWERDEWAWTAIDNRDAVAAAEVPPGTMSFYTGAVVTPPTGWLLCNGSAVSRSTYLDLFTVIGTTFGAGNGSTTFNLPDFRQRFPLGVAAAGVGSVLGQTSGAIDHVHTGPSHTHEIAGHDHTVVHTHAVLRDGWVEAAGAPTAGRLQVGGSGVGSEAEVSQATANTTSGAASTSTSSSTDLTTTAAGTAPTGQANPPLLALYALIKT